MKILVTGGAGFIGSHITERLLKDGHSVVVLDNFSSGKEENLSFSSLYSSAKIKDFGETSSAAKRRDGLSAKCYTLIKGDIRDKAMVDKACQGVDAICHQAALRSVPKSMKEPESYNDVNINGTLCLLQAAQKYNIKRFVMASSSSVYGDVTKFPEEESDYPLLISPYALSKLANEYYCRIWSEHFGLETICFRYFNVFGPRQSLDDEYAVVIPKFIHCIMHDKQPPIFGNGKQSRDFTYIDSVVSANLLGLFTKNIKHEVFNVANGKDTTVNEIVDKLNGIMGKKIKAEYLPIRPGDVFRTCASIKKIKAKLGYENLVEFDEGLRCTVEYFKKVWSK